MIDIDALLAQNDGIILARTHRHLKSSLSRWAKCGKLVRVMRGVYAHPRHGLATRIRGALARIPDGVVAGQAAMSAFSGSNAIPATIDICTPTHRMPQRGFRLTQRKIPPEYVTQNVMSPVLAAVDRASIDAVWIDDLLRSRHTAPRHFADALSACPGRPGNRARRRRVARTRTNPWSQAERQYHDLLDIHRIRGWVANYKVTIGSSWYYLDIAFRKEKLAIEVDGYKTHSSHQAFETDRRRHNDLTRAGWTVLHFTWGMLNDPDDVIHTIRATLAFLRKGKR